MGTGAPPARSFSRISPLSRAASAASGALCGRPSRALAVAASTLALSSTEMIASNGPLAASAAIVSAASSGLPKSSPSGACQYSASDFGMSTPRATSSPRRSAASRNAPAR